jgi:predicted nucleotidyltransferase
LWRQNDHSAPRHKIDTEALAELCQRYHVRDLSLFGSVLRDDFRNDSDVDVLVEFEPEAPVGLFQYSGLRFERAELFGR